MSVRRALAAAGLVVLVPLSGGAATAEDPAFANGAQWGIKRIHAVEAWNVTKGRGSIVAVLDTGVDRRHRDLRAQLLPGRDFADDDHDPIDDNGHGTLIAGIIAAQTNNGYGVASVAPSAKLLPVRVLDTDGAGTSEDVADGIRWSVDNGAHVINLSLAQDPAHGIFVPESLLRDDIVDDAIAYAVRAGAVVVVASGNDVRGGRSRTAYDSRPGVLVVGASTSDDRRAAYSNYGTGLDLLAPGGGSARDPRDRACNDPNFIVTTWWNPARKRSDFGGACGTSMAVAFVSGVAALLHSRGLDNDQIVERILDTADDLGPKGRDAKTGAGRVNAARAVGAPRARPSSKPVPKPSSSRSEFPVTTIPSAQSFGRFPVATPFQANPAATNDLPLIAAAASLIALLVLAHTWRLTRAP